MQNSKLNQQKCTGRKTLFRHDILNENMPDLPHTGAKPTGANIAPAYWKDLPRSGAAPDDRIPEGGERNGPST